MRKMKTLLYALGTATMPIAIVYGFSNYIAAQQPNTPPLPLDATSALVLGIASTVAFALCVRGLHRSFIARLDSKERPYDD